MERSEIMTTSSWEAPPDRAAQSRLRGERWMSWWVRAMAAIAILSVGLIALFIFAKGLPPIWTIGWSEFLLGDTWKPGDMPPQYGIFPMIVGSVMVTAGAMLMGAPVALAAAVYLAGFCPPRFRRTLNSLVLLLAGIPSIVYGFFGMVVLVPWVHESFSGTGSSLFTAALLLAIMILPTVISVSETAFSAVPERYYEAGRALGLTHEKTMVGVIVPAASSGVLAALVLGIGRAIGETMAVVMVAGNQAVIPTSIWEGTRTLTANIVLEIGYAADLHRDSLIASGAILFMMILCLNTVFLYLREKWVKV